VSTGTVQWCRLVLRALVRHHFKHALLLDQHVNIRRL
jgi:hypothetical protein